MCETVMTLVSFFSSSFSWIVLSSFFPTWLSSTLFLHTFLFLLTTYDFNYDCSVKHLFTLCFYLVFIHLMLHLPSVVTEGYRAAQFTQGQSWTFSKTLPNFYHFIIFDICCHADSFSDLLYIFLHITKFVLCHPSAKSWGTLSSHTLTPFNILS